MKKGQIMSEIQKIMISKKMLGMIRPKKTRDKMSISKMGHKGYWFGKKNNGEAKRMSGNTIWLGKKHSIESKKKMSEYWINHPNLRNKDTKIELRMKELLTALGVYFVFQKHFDKIANVDFYIPEKKLIIECDGCYWHGCDIHYPDRNYKQEKDKTRDLKLEALGYKVIRFWEHEINQMSLIKLE